MNERKRLQVKPNRSQNAHKIKNANAQLQPRASIDIRITPQACNSSFLSSAPLLTAVVPNGLICGPADTVGVAPVIVLVNLIVDGSWAAAVQVANVAAGAPAEYTAEFFEQLAAFVKIPSVGGPGAKVGFESCGATTVLVAGDTGTAPYPSGKPIG
jgi:hypothetical protein